MRSVDSDASMDDVADVVRSIRRKGVRLWVENGQLHYEARKGVLNSEDIGRLKAEKDRVLSYLKEAGQEPALTGLSVPSDEHYGTIPLAFSQLAHWNIYGLSKRPAIRQIASAMHLRGRLHVDALQRSFAEVVRRHEALRTRIFVSDGVPFQKILRTVEWSLSIEDLTSSEEHDRPGAITRSLEDAILQPIEITADTLFAVKLLWLGTDEHVLIVTIEHIVSDAFSINVLMRELFTAYSQTILGRCFELPPIAIQFSDYVLRQRHSEIEWRLGESVGRQQLGDYERLRFPLDADPGIENLPGWGTIPLLIDRGLRDDLREWSRMRQTTLVLAVFSVYAALVLRWCNSTAAVFQYEIDGRTSPNMENAIGYFASELYLVIGISERTTFVDLAQQVISEYGIAFNNSDCSYLKSLVTRPDFTHNTHFNWVPQGAGADFSCLEKSEYALKTSPIHFSHPMLKTLDIDAEPNIMLMDTPEGITGRLAFPLNRCSPVSMRRFVESFYKFIAVLLTQPDAPINDLNLS
jgi:hypothetical protein